MKIKSYSTGKKCCKTHKSLITVREIKQSFECECNDCGKIIKGKEGVMTFILS